MTTVETALGSLATAQLGPTSMHEHIVTRSPEQMLVGNPRALFEAVG